MKDDTLILDGLKGYDINDPILFDQVLMVGTKTYTSIGRPLVLSAKVSYFIHLKLFYLSHLPHMGSARKTKPPAGLVS